VRFTARVHVFTHARVHTLRYVFVHTLTHAQKINELNEPSINGWMGGRFMQITQFCVFIY
jgi:hypothetical protein